MATRFMDRLIEVGTKASRREPVSGETLSAARRQLQRLRASPFDFARYLKSNLQFNEQCGIERRAAERGTLA